MNEEILTKNLQELNNAIDESTIVSRTSLEGVITYVNDAFCALSQYAKEEIIGQRHSLFNSGLMGDYFYKELWETITSKNIFKGVIKNRAKDGSIYYFSVAIKPLLDIDSNIYEYIAIGHNVTELMNALEDVQKEKENKEDFLRNIGHELRTPLNSIVALLPLIIKRSSEEKALKMLSAVQENATALYKLISLVNDYRLFENKKFHRINKAFRLETSLLSFLEEVEKKLTCKEQYFSIDIDTSRQTLIGDPDMLVQLLGIFLDNAIKFTPRKGCIELSIHLNKDIKCLEIDVKDNGIGIDSANHTKIFELQQLDSALERSFEGIGLGLALAKSMIEFVGGRIELQSALNMGANFKIIYPIKIEQEENQMIDTNTLKILTSPMTLMFVEDDDIARNMYDKVFKRLFGTVHTFSNGKDAFDFYQNNSLSIDLVITDITMPLMSGIVLAEKIKDLYDEQKIIMLSAHDDKEKVFKLINIGVDGFILKPPSIEDLESTLFRVATIVNDKKELLQARQQLAFKSKVSTKQAEQKASLLNTINALKKQELTECIKQEEEVQEKEPVATTTAVHVEVNEFDKDDITELREIIDDIDYFIARFFGTLEYLEIDMSKLDRLANLYAKYSFILKSYPSFATISDKLFELSCVLRVLDVKEQGIDIAHVGDLLECINQSLLMFQTQVMEEQSVEPNFYDASLVIDIDITITTVSKVSKDDADSEACEIEFF